MPKRRRRSFTPQFKAPVVLEVLSGLKSQAAVARHHKLKPELITRWKAVTIERGWSPSSWPGNNGIRNRIGSPGWE
jgi:transposase-like protein